MAIIRPFKMDDAGFCFRVRSTAFITEFYDEIGSEAVAAGVNAFMPEDYIAMAKEAPFFIVAEEDDPIGFFTLRRVDETTAELPLIYIALNRLGKGIGSRCIRFMEEWIRTNWRDVRTLFVDTIIPVYNGGFYRKMGFRTRGKVPCDFPGMSIPAMRLSKPLSGRDD